jgi:ParB-like chromosome segregation protein Spo0J
VALEIVYKPLDALVPAPRNPKRHDLTTIQASYARFGYAEAIVEDGRTGRLVSGHGRVEALQALRDAGAEPPAGVQDWMVPVQVGWASNDDEEAWAFLVAANRLTETGGWDDRSLADLLEVVSATAAGLEGTGYSAEELADLVALVGMPPELDELARRYGEPGEDDFWAVLRFRVPPEVEKRYRALTDGVEGDDGARFAWLVERAGRP